MPKSSIFGQAQTFVTSDWWHSQETMAVTGGRIQDTRVAGAAEPKERRVQKEKEDRVSVSQVLSIRGPPVVAYVMLVSDGAFSCLPHSSFLTRLPSLHPTTTVHP